MSGKRLISLLCFILLGVSAASAQIRIISREKLDSVSNPPLAANAAYLDFVKRHIKAEPLSEDDAPRQYSFPFRNVSDKEVTISRIVSSCSCAQARSENTVVAPGEESSVIVTYNPKGHPGRFERRIFVYTDDNAQPSAILRLSVDVSGSSSDPSGEYPVDMGKIRLRTREVKMAHSQKSVARLVFLNVSGKPLTLECERMMLPDCIGFRAEPQTVGDGEQGEIVLTYDPEKSRNARREYPVMLKGLGLPPSQSSIKVIIE